MRTTSSKNITRIKGQLEIDHKKGVILFRLADSGVFDGEIFFQITSLPTPIPRLSNGPLGMDYIGGTNWNSDEER